MSDISKLIDRLKTYYDSLSEDNMKEVATFMNTDIMKNIYEKLSDDINSEKSLDKEELELTEAIAHLANSIYTHSGYQTGISDSDYDAFVEYLRMKTDEELISEKMIEDTDVVYHKFKTLRGTLDKIYKLTDDDVIKNKSQKTISDWVKTSERKIKEETGKTINLFNQDVMVMPKFDGVSVIFECSGDGTLKRALLRGDTSRNETKDVAHIFKGIFKPPITDSPYEYGLKTEVMMLDSDFEDYNLRYHTDYKSTRSIVSSILNSDDIDDRVNYLQIIPLRVSYYIDGIESEQELAEGLFNYPYIKCKLGDLEKIHEFSFTHKTVSPGLRCDGSVIYIIDKELQKLLGREHEKQKFEVAFKFTEEVAYSKVIDIEFNTGLFGTINPVVRFKPVKMKGNTIERASLGSYARFLDLGLSKGDVIKINYDIIPYIIMDLSDNNCSKSGNERIIPPLICNECGTPFEENKDSTSYYCPNKKCPCRVRGKILNYCKKMNIEFISDATVIDFYNAGILNSIDDLYNLKNHKLFIMDMPGYKEKKIDNILNSISSKDTTNPSELFGSIGIQGISVKTFKNVFNYFNIEDVIDLATSNNIIAFTVCKGVKEKTATKIVEGILENIETIDFLRKELTVLPEPSIGDTLFNVVFSKVRDTELEQFIMEYGGNISSSVTSKTNFIIVPNLVVSSGKIDKAKELNIPVVVIDDAKTFIEEHY